MKQRHEGGDGRHFAEPVDRDYRHGRHHDHHGHQHHAERHGERRGGRPFDYGELRLLVLAMLAEQPRHGYEIMKLIEERMGGSYSPSPGVIYPTLSWLVDMGYASVESEEAGRKRYGITAEGTSFLVANRAAVDAMTSRVRPDRRHGDMPSSVLRGMENLKMALRLRLKQGAISDDAAAKITAALDAAVLLIEQN